MSPRDRDGYGHAGFTLAEVLVAAGIFVIFAALSFQIVIQVTRHVGVAKEEAEAYLRAATAAEVLTSDLKQAVSDDLGLVNGVPIARFLSQPEEGGSHMLALVTSFGRGPERGSYLTDTLSGDEFHDSTDDDGDGVVDNNLIASDGFAEVVYFVRGSTLYRAHRSPVTGSMQDLQNPSRGRKVASGVLHFALRFWGPETQEWDPPSGATLKKGRERFYSLDSWDSTRGLGSVFKNFPYSRPGDTVTDPSDDVFPRMVEVLLVMDGGRSRSEVIARPAGMEDSVLQLGSTGRIPGADMFPYLLIGDEWVRYLKIGKRTLTVERGVWGTRRRPHERGTPVRWGYPVRFRVFVPAGKDAYDIEGAASYRRAGR